ncbi:MAG TPA: 16S rRNA (guanine(527)-N(7))-methyltransferase RsmG [Syntrophomonadaceae bacterium]|nr:16S rRNA (guanine(527)-N(7))-methyltransferase RsmG [Syntrophomonadaceae bacterium]
MEYNVNRFKEMLLEENRKQNLISRRNPHKEIDKHIEDSRKALDFFDMEGKRIVDIGSGAGFPGMILAMLVPNAEIILVESDMKKSVFLSTVKAELDIANVGIVNQRAEILGQDPAFRESFDLCTNRAVAAVRVILEYGLPLLIPGGRVVMWKGRNYLAEMQEASTALEILGGQASTVYSYSLMDELDRTLVVVEKTRATPDKYPRRNGLPGKRPL